MAEIFTYWNLLEEIVLIKKEITQGSVITNIRSRQYHNSPCYGIVISARCDFAQEKIKNFYLLSALPIKIWVNEVLVDEILAQDEANKKKKLLDYAEEKEIDIKSFMDRNTDSFEAKLGQIEGLDKDVKSALKDKHKAWQKAIFLLSQPQTEKRKEINSNKLKSKLTPLYNGNISNRCFIPEKSYSTNSIKTIASHIQDAINMSFENSTIPHDLIDKLRSLSVELLKITPKDPEESELTNGLVVDLFDIIALSMDIRSSIESGEYTSEAIPEELQQLFYIDSAEQHVHVESIISSPYIEYIMQRFSNAFVRIGVENASDTQIQRFCEEIVSEWKEVQT